MKNQIHKMLICLVFLLSLSCQKDETTDTPTSAKEELDAKLKAEVSSKNLTSIAFCIVKNDKILYSGAQGLADKTNNKLATDNTRYLIASVSKTVTAVALMQLVEQNRIALHDDINQFLPFPVRNPDFPNTKITARMLLSHTSSISDEHQNTITSLDAYGTDCAMTLAQYFDNVFLSSGQYFSTNNFSDKQPGTTEDYSNLASALVGYLVERISQTPFDIYCKNHIFTPLDMKKTEWRLANIPISELAIPYSPEITNPNPHYTSPDYPNGGLRSTVLDLSKFLSMVIQNGTFNGTQILSSASMASMKTLQFGSANQCLSFYYDTINGKRVLGHSGGEKGVTAEMYYDTNTNIGVIVFSNVEDANLNTVLPLLFNYGEKQ